MNPLGNWIAVGERVQLVWSLADYIKAGVEPGTAVFAIVTKVGKDRNDLDFFRIKGSTKMFRPWARGIDWRRAS
jgi:hypothetical protein